MLVFQKKTWEIKLNKLNMEYFSNQLKSNITKVVITDFLKKPQNCQRSFQGKKWKTKNLKHYYCSLLLKTKEANLLSFTALYSGKPSSAAKFKRYKGES